MGNSLFWESLEKELCCACLNDASIQPNEVHINTLLNIDTED